MTSTYFVTNPSLDMPEVGFVFFPRLPSFKVSFELSADHRPDLGANEVRLSRAFDILADVGVAFVFVDKSKIRDMEWFSNDRDHFDLAYQNSGIAVFEVMN